MIRIADEKDVNGLAKISKENVDPAWGENDFATALKNPQAVVFVSEADDINGYAVCYIAADEGVIPSIAVDKAYRRCGIGDELFYALSSYIIEKGVMRLFLEVREGNEAAVSFYEHNGFLQVGRRKNFYERPKEDALVLEKKDLKG